MKYAKMIRRMMKRGSMGAKQLGSGSTTERKPKMVPGVRKMMKRSAMAAGKLSERPSIARPGDKVVRIPVGSMVTADIRPDRVRQFVDASGRVKYERRG